MEIPKEHQEFIRQAVVDTVRASQIMEASFTAGIQELEPDGEVRNFKPDGTLEIYVKLQTKQEEKK